MYVFFVEKSIKFLQFLEENFILWNGKKELIIFYVPVNLIDKKAN